MSQFWRSCRRGPSCGDRLGELGDQVVLVRGNADRELVGIVRGEPVDIPDEVTPWAAAQLSPVHVELLGSLPHPVTIDVDGFGPVLFCHGTPRSDIDAAIRSIVDGSTFPERAEWADYFLRATSSDAEALRLFAP